ncbi:hypothetical protein CALVIDRAFT_93468 [Calocera viscosa TUFC12733]|uniref:Uncharacterized protein n=1 Tax=Calocera viscosa (strain TUFC12733) TaxID=1330018 RepID=A0A167MVK8_CALVF|nr:hypothetical protein CALVIDRAFT_93468 [Calocera viscosa TUFC12733]
MASHCRTWTGRALKVQRAAGGACSGSAMNDIDHDRIGGSNGAVRYGICTDDVFPGRGSSSLSIPACNSRRLYCTVTRTFGHSVPCSLYHSHDPRRVLLKPAINDSDSERSSIDIGPLPIGIPITTGTNTNTITADDYDYADAYRLRLRTRTRTSDYARSPQAAASCPLAPDTDWHLAPDAIPALPTKGHRDRVDSHGPPASSNESTFSPFPATYVDRVRAVVPFHR